MSELTSRPVYYARTLDPSVENARFNSLLPKMDFLRDTGKQEFVEVNKAFGNGKVTKFQIKDLLKTWIENTAAKIKKIISKWSFKDSVQSAANKIDFDVERRQEFLKRSFMTYDEISEYLNLTHKPKPSTTPPPLSITSKDGLTTYEHVRKSVAEFYKPYETYAKRYYSGPSTEPLIPAEVYPWNWSDSITSVFSMINNITVLEASGGNSTESSEGNLMGANPINSTNGSILIETLVTIHAKFHLPSGLPKPPMESMQPHEDFTSTHFTNSMLHFYAYPDPSAGAWLRSGVTVFTPTFSTNKTPKTMIEHLHNMIDLAFGADLAGILLGIESPSSVWLSLFDRTSDEFADLCLGEIVRNRKLHQMTNDTLYETMIKNSPKEPSCIWAGHSYYYAAKRKSKRTNSPTSQLLELAAYAGERALNVTAIKSTIRDMRRIQAEEEFKRANETTPIAVMGNGYIFKGPNEDQILLEMIKEPEPIHLIHRLVIRLGESSFLSSSEMDTFVACVCFHILSIMTKYCNF